MNGLPAALKAALDRELEGVRRAGLADRAAATSAAYRAGRTSAATIKGAEDALAYALVRLPATYAACEAALSEARRMAPGFAPTTLLDAGAGPGGGTWAAAEVFRLQRATRLDASPPFLALAGRLGAPVPTEAVRADLTAGGFQTADLVLASYALAEIAPADQARVLGALWAATTGLLVIVEPGASAGYARILAARAALIAAGARIAAPCPHETDCPLTGADWCHFAVRLPRSRDHLALKGAEVPFEDEKFSYLVAARPHVTLAPRTPRVLAPPRASKPGLDLKLCAEGGLQNRFVGKRDRSEYARVRRLDWGDALPQALKHAD